MGAVMSSPSRTGELGAASFQAAALTFLLVFSAYVDIMSRTHGFIDRGELAAVASTLGIAHPTSYPTLTRAGHRAVQLSSSVRPIVV
jgi:hypothetical protein